MDLQTELKVELHKMIEQITDLNILQLVYVILEKERRHEESIIDSNVTLDPIVDASILRGLEQIKAGATVPHDDVRKRYEKWLK